MNFRKNGTTTGYEKKTFAGGQAQKQWNFGTINITYQEQRGIKKKDEVKMCLGHDDH